MSTRTSRLTRGHTQERISRRGLIGGAVGLVVAGHLAPGVGPGPASVEAAPGATLSALTRVHFASLMGHTFQIQSPDGQVVDAVLRRVRVPRPTRSARRAAEQPSLETFTLIFASHQPALSQDTYIMRHPSLGEFPLFLVPSTYMGAHAAYAATFNRLMV
jgi:hypothetical protein